MIVSNEQDAQAMRCLRAAINRQSDKWKEKHIYPTATCANTDDCGSRFCTKELKCFKERKHNE